MSTRSLRNTSLFNIDLESVKKIIADANVQLIDISENLVERFGNAPQTLQSSVDEQECIKLVNDIEDILSQTKQTRITDNKPFQHATREVKKFFTNIEDPLNTILIELKERLTKRALKEQNTQKFNEEKTPSSDFAPTIITSSLGDNVVSANFKDDNHLASTLELQWELDDFDIKDLDLEKLRYYFTPSALTMALRKHLYDNGPNQVPGASYIQTFSK